MKKQIIIILMSVILVFSNLSVVNADSKPWKAAYTRILNNWKLVENYKNAATKSLKNRFGTDYKFDQYFLCDVDKNNIPELFLHSSAMGFTVVFTYNKNSGIAVCLGTDDFYKINSSKKVLVVKGRRNAVKGSGDKGYAVYKIGINRLEDKYYIDFKNEYMVIKDANWDARQSTYQAYNKVYKEYIKDGKLFSQYNKYKLSDKRGLNKINT